VVGSTEGSSEISWNGIKVGLSDGLGSRLTDGAVVLNILSSSGKSTLPQPVSGSQPFVAWKPLGQQLLLFPPQHVLVPEVMSLNFLDFDIP
jgi:hypothetical protein